MLIADDELVVVLTLHRASPGPGLLERDRVDLQRLFLDKRLVRGDHLVPDLRVAGLVQREAAARYERRDRRDLVAESAVVYVHGDFLVKTSEERLQLGRTLIGPVVVQPEPWR